MKKIFAAALLGLAMLSGCTTRTDAGPCVGVVDQKKPGVEYELSYWNLFVGIVFVETLVVPTVVVLKELECPISK